ncbi:MAG: hypothetical protein NTW01_19050 [Gammaproteobacteria bacterium]|nr:hypothetical protein [Gammaproteobacteria bacterium]
MNRREFARGAIGLATFGSLVASADEPRMVAKAKAAVDHSAHAGMDHSAHQAASGRYAALAATFSDCAAAAEDCIAHCQSVLATGDKSLGECLKTALACDTSCVAVARLARLDSEFTASFAKASIAVMEACAAACKPHVEHHAICKACFDACGKTIIAAKAI